jgi:ferrous iron transport protein B
MMATVALAGNPNCGKTSIFNALTGARHHVANWPGVTVEKRSGTFSHDGQDVEVVDLPGTYSLAAQSEDERIAAGFLLSEDVDVIVDVLDASNLERNLYLTTQLLELGKPLVFALNMADDAGRRGMEIDTKRLEALLGGRVLATVANRGQGIDALKKAVAGAANGERAGMHALAGAGSSAHQSRVRYGEDIEREIEKLSLEIGRDEDFSERYATRWSALRLLEGTSDAEDLLSISHARQAIDRQRCASREFLERHLGADCPTLVAEQRYGFARGLVKEVVRQSAVEARGVTDRLDAVLTHRWLGIPIFIGVMLLVYVLTFVLGKYPQDWVTAAFAWLQTQAAVRLPGGELTSLVVDGIIPGVGAVVVFVPVIMILMGCISFLEDTGYMARAAFIMDRLMHLMGLHGRSFIPLVMGTGCNVPALQATRTIEARTDRFITILVTPLVSCSARLQVYILIAGTFFTPVRAAIAIIAMHVLGFGLAMIVGKVFRLTLFRGASAPFVMELPPYRMPVLSATAVHMWEKGRVFLTRAGTVILAGATLVWFLSHYPGIANAEWSAAHLQQQTAVRALKLPPEQERQRLDALDLERESRVMNTSLAASFGQLLEPVLAPILDPDGSRANAWKDGVALTAGFVAKEIVVGTMGVLYQASPETENGTERPLQVALRRQSGLTPLTALAFMVFTLIYTPCLGTVGMMLKETRSASWTTFSVAYGLVLAWGLSWAVVTVGHLAGWR